MTEFSISVWNKVKVTLNIVKLRNLSEKQLNKIRFSFEMFQTITKLITCISLCSIDFKGFVSL